MNLTNKASDIKTRLLALQDWSRRKNDAQALAHRRSEWRARRDALKRICDQLEWIGQRKEALADLHGQVKLSRTLIASARQILTDGGDNAELTHDDHWAKTLSATEKTVSLLTDYMKNGWKKHIEVLGNFRSPTAIATTLPISRPGNRVALDEYSSVFFQYLKLTRLDGPNSREDVTTLKHLTTRLQSLGSNFNFSEVPTPVRQFYAAIDSGKGASLSLLTSEVRDWLEAEGQSGAFVVMGIR